MGSFPLLIICKHFRKYKKLNSPAPKSFLIKNNQPDLPDLCHDLLSSPPPRSSLGLKISAALLHRVVELTLCVSHLSGHHKTCTAPSHGHHSFNPHPSATVSMCDVSGGINFTTQYEWPSHERLCSCSEVRRKK